jgi:hypothetical protein
VALPPDARRRPGLVASRSRCGADTRHRTHGQRLAQAQEVHARTWRAPSSARRLRAGGRPGACAIPLLAAACHGQESRADLLAEADVDGALVRARASLDVPRDSPSIGPAPRAPRAAPRWTPRRRAGNVAVSAASRRRSSIEGAVRSCFPFPHRVSARRAHLSRLLVIMLGWPAPGRQGWAGSRARSASGPEQPGALRSDRERADPRFSSTRRHPWSWARIFFVSSLALAMTSRDAQGVRHVGASCQQAAQRAVRRANASRPERSSHRSTPGGHARSGWRRTSGDAGHDHRNAEQSAKASDPTTDVGRG